MLPFLKNKEAMVQSNAEDEVLKRKPDDGEEDYGVLDAIADDMMDALEKKNKSLLRSALEALCDYLKEEDEEQDEKLLTPEGES